ncbi:AFR634Wp [Eremothecium gossypii ATCC 10895]|uniref:AFR634Wp n=1 Tax=Eremothecium gossypii (strain ATCC 10895 / CBS 109.51 / FGSC 9923 / NRRL Y-1056) TaxID=284811 RepID=Q752E2_EREGS|nr:AFR634Wp [Eremothecium gossypii ATCC 10895]AAS54005.1 AFR634Wp [Eremothecium gossypii ATCC 10895]AEY98319.1 FAFR634Wp [Eremothecium gossypii FDAG1]
MHLNVEPTPRNHHNQTVPSSMEGGSKSSSAGPSQAESLTPERASKLYKRFFNVWKQRAVRIRDDHFHRMEHPSRLERRPTVNNRVIALASNSVGSLATWARTDGSITVMNVATERYSFTIKEAQGVGKLCLSIAWNPVEADQFVTVGTSTSVKLWNASDSKNPLLKTLVTGSRIKNYKCLFDPLGQWLLVLTKASEIYLYAATEGYRLHSISKIQPEHEAGAGSCDTVESVAWLNDGQHIILGFKLGSIKIFKLGDAGFEIRNTMFGHLKTITSLAVDPWGLYFVAGSEDGSCSLWSLKDFTCKTVHSEPEGVVESVSISDDGFVLAVGSRMSSREQSKFSFRSLLGQENMYEISFNSNANSLVHFIPETMKVLFTEERDIVTILKSTCSSILYTSEESEKMEAGLAATSNVKRMIAARDEERKSSKKRRADKLRTVERSKEPSIRSKLDEGGRQHRRIEERSLRREEDLRGRGEAVGRYGRDEYVPKRF